MLVSVPQALAACDKPVDHMVKVKGHALEAALQDLLIVAGSE